MGIGLTPQVRTWVSGIDVVAEGLLLAAPQIYLFPLKARIGPIFLESHGAGYAHRIDDVFLALGRFRAGSRHPVANSCRASNLWFAGGECTHAKEGIGRKA